MSAALAIHHVLKERGLSRDGIAAEFVARYRFKPPDKKRSARSFAAEIRKLERGDVTWFTRRPPAARLIAEILESTPVELGIGSNDDLVHYADFPEITGLDLAKEDPFAIGKWRSLIDAASAHPIWLSAGPGVGKTLFSRWAEKRGLAIRIEARTLSSVENDIASALDSIVAPLVVIVDVARVEPDDLGVPQRLGKPKLIVLAAEPRPHNPDAPGSWIDYGLPPESFDRRGFVEWIARHLPEGPSVVERLWRKLIEVDPTGTLIATPDDMIQFLGAAFEKRTVNTVDAIVHRAALKIESPWLASHGRELFRSLAVARWVDLRYPYGQPVPRDVWESYVSSDLVVPRDRRTIRAALEEFRDNRRADIDDVADRLLRDRRSVVALLEEARLLVREHDGLLSLRPRWLAHADAIHHVRKLVATDPRRACGVTVDASRRSVLDGLLVRLEESSWLKFVKAAVQACEEDDLEAIAVVETAFATIARRHEQGRDTKDKKALDVIASKQISVFLSRHENGLPGPATRPGVHFLGGDSFVADCWTWSLAISKPTRAQLAEAWLFPGWAEAAPSELPSWLHGLGGIDSSDALDRLRRTLGKCLAKWSPTRWQDPPTWMWLALLTCEQTWPLDTTKPTTLRGERTASEVAEALGGLTADRATAVLRRIWSIVSPWWLWDVVNLLKGPLGQRLLDTLDHALVASAIPRWARDISSGKLREVPAPLRGPLVAWALEHDPGLADTIMTEATHLDVYDPALLVRFADRSGSRRAIQRLWQVAPEVAIRELEERLIRRTIDVAYWLEGPPSATASILEVVERHPAIASQAMLQRWAAGRLLHQPWLATRLWQFVRPVP